MIQILRLQLRWPYEMRQCSSRLVPQHIARLGPPSRAVLAQPWLVQQLPCLPASSSRQTSSAYQHLLRLLRTPLRTPHQDCRPPCWLCSAQYPSHLDRRQFFAFARSARLHTSWRARRTQMRTGWGERGGHGADNGAQHDGRPVWALNQHWRIRGRTQRQQVFSPDRASSPASHPPSALFVPAA